MKKQRRKRERKLNLLKRDNYRCGIHLGGCGKEITLEEISVDHIIPKNIMKPNKLIEVKKRYKKRTKESLANGLFNLQAMCSECNNFIKKGRFPARNIIKKCSNKCCKFIYHKEKNKWYLVFSHYILKDGDNPTYKDGSPKGKLIQISFKLTDVQLKFMDGTTSEKMYMLFEKNKRITGFLPNSLGGSVSELDMKENNKRYGEQEIADSKKALLYEITRLMW